VAQLERIRVRCEACSWSGGRSVRDPLGRPCFSCGAPVVLDGDPYLEHRVWVGCRSCSKGHNRAGPVSGTCKRCGTAFEAAYLVLLDGTVLAS